MHSFTYTSFAGTNGLWDGPSLELLASPEKWNLAFAVFHMMVLGVDRAAGARMKSCFPQSSQFHWLQEITTVDGGHLAVDWLALTRSQHLKNQTNKKAAAATTTRNRVLSPVVSFPLQSKVAFSDEAC